MLTTKKKRKIIGEHQVHKTDTGSAEVQVALLTREITDLTAHLKQHPHDNHSRRGLLKMVGKRKRLLAYLAKHDAKRHASLTRALGLKK